MGSQVLFYRHAESFCVLCFMGDGNFKIDYEVPQDVEVVR